MKMRQGAVDGGKLDGAELASLGGLVSRGEEQDLNVHFGSRFMSLGVGLK